MIQHKVIDGLLLRDMALAGATLLEHNREMVDALNVFPVPDGDTGTNMSLTMQSALREINSKEFLRADEAAAALSKGALRGARGNSGVITSQLLRGFSKALAGVEKITPVQFAEALKKGSELAYKAVMRPKEGTILTVARVVADEALRQAAEKPDDYDALFNTILSSGDAILAKTTEMLPALKQANVVDSGGTGLMLIYRGYAAALRGEDVDSISAASSTADADEAAMHDLDREISFIYCTSFSLRHLEECEEGDVDSFRRRLKRMGEFVKVEGDLSEIRVHIHTNEPGLVIQHGLELGEVCDVKIDNLAEMKRRKQAAEAEAQAAKEPPKEFGMVAVSLGDGFSQIFKDLTVDVVVEGGQTMNPSIEDILKAINSTNAKCVFVFPDNGNVILAAQQAAKLAEDKDVRVIPTKNVAMGIAAAVAFQPDISADDNEARMNEASEHVRTCTVTYAIRDSEFEGVTIKQGDIIGLHNGRIAQAGQQVHDVALNMMKDIVTEDDELITVYYGADVSEADAQQVADEIGAAWPNCDVECLRGGQPLYYYLIAVE